MLVTRATELPGVTIVEPRVFADPRGLFLETWNRQKFAAAGIETNFVQDNHSFSVAGVLRGLHYQVEHRKANWCGSCAARFSTSASICVVRRPPSAAGRPCA